MARSQARIDRLAEEKRQKETSSAMSPSIDKIDPSLGYTKDNCRVILFGVNLLKFNGNDKTMYRIAKALVSNYESKGGNIT